MAKKPQIKLDSVSKTYQLGEVEISALTDISLKIYEGEFIVILGPSGSGKTTLLNLIGGLDLPSQGRIEVSGTFVNELNQKQLTDFRRRQTGFIFQFFNLIPTLTALENVALSYNLSHQRDITPPDVLEAVGLAHRKYHFPSQLSGGEQQRVAVARALAKNAPLMLCDEPTGELDYETGIKILSLLRELNDKSNKTFLIVTHNTAIGRIADRTIKLRSGKIISDEINSEVIDPNELTW